MVTGMKGMFLLWLVIFLAACSYDSGPYHALSGNYDKGVAVVNGGNGFEVYYSKPPRPYQTVGFVSLTGGADLLPELQHLAAARGADAAVITSQQSDRVGQNTSTITLGFGTAFVALPTYSNSQSRDVYVQKISATLVKLE
jgi:hypothetical protein